MNEPANSEMKRGHAFVDLDQALNYQFKPFAFSYDKDRVMQYALAVGAGSDPSDRTELQFVYELNRTGFKALPTLAAIFPFEAIGQIAAVPGLKFNFMNLLHGEHYLELKRPLPVEGTVFNSAHISQIYDKGSGALVVVDMHSRNDAGEEIAFSQASLFIRGIGGFGGDRGPSGAINIPPEREPDAVFSDKTSQDQALRYRIAAGDRNPLHADPDLAAMVGFQRPILHGLCTFGFAGRAVLKQFAGNNPERLKHIKARFTKHVFPGESLLTEMWQESDTRILFQTKVLEREAIVLSNGAVELGMD